MNKKILIILIFITFFWLGKRDIYSQTQQILGVVNYNTYEQLTFLFQNSDRTLVYLSGERVDAPTFVGLFNSDQKRAIQDYGLNFQTIDEQADLERYVMLYHPLPNQGAKLEYLGEPIQFAKHFTLLKLSEGTFYSHGGVAGEFFEVPFLEGITPPPNATPVIPLTQPTTVPQIEKQRGNIIIAVILFVVVSCIIIFGVFLYIKRKKDSQAPQF